MRQIHSKTSALILSITMVLSGCASTLVRDDVKRTAGLDGHCAGSEWVDDSSLAVLPVPVVAFFVPHFDLHKVSAEPYSESVRGLDPRRQSRCVGQQDGLPSRRPHSNHYTRGVAVVPSTCGLVGRCIG